MSRCLDCEKPITKNCQRCVSCNNRRQTGKECSKETREKIRQSRLGKYIKHGKATYQHYCKDCNTKIDWRAERCKSCSLKFQLRGATLLDKVGANNPCYRGGRTQLHFLIRELKQSQEWKITVFLRDKRICQECSGKDNIEAHHKIPFSKIFTDFLEQYSQFSPIEDKETLVRLAMNYEPFWNINNGQTLCKECHNKKRGEILK